MPNEYIKEKEPKDDYIYPIYSNGVGKNALYGYAKNYKISDTAVTISARGTIGYHTVRTGKFTTIVRLLTLIPDENIIMASYLNYILYKITFNESGAGIKQLTVPNIKNIKIPVPPLDLQEKIVNILDKFDKLTNDISEGLPAEIEARQKQYEYYRNKLLSFKELKTA